MRRKLYWLFVSVIIGSMLLAVHIRIVRDTRHDAYWEGVDDALDVAGYSR